jgi:hypothetical protein
MGDDVSGADHAQRASASHFVGSPMAPHGSGVMHTPAGQDAPAGQAAPIASHVQPFAVSAAQSSGRACDEHESLTTAAGSVSTGVTLPHAAARPARAASETSWVLVELESFMRRSVRKKQATHAAPKDRGRSRAARSDF